MGIKHTFVSNVVDVADDTQIRPSSWNADHTIDGDVDLNGFEITNVGNIADISGWINVKDPPYNATGDGVTDDTAAIQAALNDAFAGSVNNSSTNCVNNKRLRIPAGSYIVTGLELPDGSFGCELAGDGNFSTNIYGVLSGDASIFYSNGFRNSLVRDMRIQIVDVEFDGANQCCWDLDFEGSPSTAPTSVTFERIDFAGRDGSDTIGVRVGNSNGNNNSEHRFIQCGFGDHLYGLWLRQFNNLNVVVEDGGATNCQRAYYVERGSISRIQNVSCADNDCDIYCKEGTSLTVVGVRTESDGFIQFHLGLLTVIGCSQTTDDSVFFLSNDFGTPQDRMIFIEGCQSINGTVDLRRGSGGTSNNTPPNMVINSQFGRDDWYNANSVFRYFNLEVGKVNGNVNGTGTYDIWRDGVVGDRHIFDSELISFESDNIDFTDSASLIVANGTFMVEPGLVSALPAAVSFPGGRGTVTDATVTTFASVVAGGGANKVPVYSDGTNWRIG